MKMRNEKVIHSNTSKSNKKLENKYRNLFYFSNFFETLRDLQHLNISYNTMGWFDREQCNSSKKKIRETLDFSNNRAKELIGEYLSFISECAQFKNIYLRNNGISSIENSWDIFHKSLRVLDLSKNEISDLSVSNKYFIKYKTTSCKIYKNTSQIFYFILALRLFF